PPRVAVVQQMLERRRHHVRRRLGGAGEVDGVVLLVGVDDAAEMVAGIHSYLGKSLSLERTPRWIRKMIFSRGASFYLVHNPPMLLRPRDPIASVQTCQNKLNARGPHRLVLAGVDLEGLVPGLGHTLEALGIVARRQHVADLDLHA